LELVLPLELERAVEDEPVPLRDGVGVNVTLGMRDEATAEMGPGDGAP